MSRSERSHGFMEGIGAQLDGVGAFSSENRIGLSLDHTGTLHLSDIAKNALGRSSAALRGNLH